MIGVDDVHLLDDLSTFVLHQIVQRGAAKVILTVRDGEPIPAAVRRLDGRPVRPARPATALARRNHHAAVGRLGWTGGSGCRQRLWKLTRGNVLYLRNIVEQEVADGRTRARARVLAVDR